MLVGACGPDPTAPRGSHDQASPLARLGTKTSVATSATLAIDDALTRLLGSLDEGTAAALKGPLTAVRATLGSGDRAALTGAIAVARQALGGCMPLADDPDLAAVSLALDAAANGQ